VKRSESLASPSRDHHQALVIARRLRRAGPNTAEDARRAFLSYWASHGRRHFRLEEEVLFPAYAAYGDAHHPLLVRALGDHVAIRHAAAVTASEPPPALAALNELGGRLDAHVRLEERELFPLIEQALPEHELEALAEALARADSVV
jgi:hemerythrin-like domain-containing protein